MCLDSNRIRIPLVSTENAVVFARQRKTVSCNNSVKLPKGQAGLICPNRELADVYGITVLDSPNIVTGENEEKITVVLYNTDDQNVLRIKEGDQIADLLVVPYF